MNQLRNITFGLLAAVLVGTPAVALAYGDGTPDTQPPAELRGAAYGLCVAYCEANDCEIQPDKHACAVLLGNFERITGESAVPCVGIGIQ